MDRIYRVGIEEVPKRLTLNEQEHLRLTFIVMPGVSAEIPFEINIGKAGVNLEIYGLYLSPHSEQVKFGHRGRQRPRRIRRTGVCG